MNPEPKLGSFIRTGYASVWEVLIQIALQRLGMWWLTEGTMVGIIGINAHTPLPLMDIDTDVKLQVTKI
jgi:hypothetical protein